MYIYQNGKLYLQEGEQLVGVNIDSDKVVSVEGSQTILADDFMSLTSYEVRCKFQLHRIPYVFPIGEVKKDEPVSKPKRSPRKHKSE